MSIAEKELGKSRVAVAPRVTWQEHDEPMRLVDRVEMWLRRGTSGWFVLQGGPGSGKSTALRELVKHFADCEQLRVVDEGPGSQANWPAHALVIFAAEQPLAKGGLHLAPWGPDEWIEYMLGRWRNRCSAVMGRVLKDSFANRLDGNAQLWATVLDEMAIGPDSLDIRAALRRHVAWVALSPQRHAETAGMCVGLLSGKLTENEFKSWFLPAEKEFSRLLRHRAVQVLLAGDMLAHWLCDVGDMSVLAGNWPLELIDETALGLSQRNGMLEILESVLESHETELHPTAASLLLALEPTWRPSARYMPNLSGAHLRKAQWQHVDLFGVRLEHCRLESANLRSARLQKAKARNIHLPGADLGQALMQSIDGPGGDFARANMSEVQAQSGNFAHANFQGANLHKAVLHKALLVGACLGDAQLCGADLRKADLSHASLEGADFSDANLSRAVFKNPMLRESNLSGARLCNALLAGCDMEEMDLRAIDLSGAVLSSGLLTGACLAGANLKKADLRQAGLAEIDLEGADLRGADLRGASFHLGSTRSGLVGSVVPCEGSKTGFYTDEVEERQFRRPEEIRKANLSYCDLRGARIKGVDFYLVDLRGAKYTGRQGKYLKKCGAIMT